MRKIKAALVEYKIRLAESFESVAEFDLYAKVKHCLELFSTMRAREAWAIHGDWVESVHPNLAPEIEKRILSCKEATAEQAFDGAIFRKRELLEIDALLGHDTIMCLPTTCNLPPLKNASDEEFQENRSRNIAPLTPISLFLWTAANFNPRRKRRWNQNRNLINRWARNRLFAPALSRRTQRRKFGVT